LPVGQRPVEKKDGAVAQRMEMHLEDFWLDICEVLALDIVAEDPDIVWRSISDRTSYKDDCEYLEESRLFRLVIVRKLH
jgi:hypothetical protein